MSFNSCPIGLVFFAVAVAIAIAFVVVVVVSLHFPFHYFTICFPLGTIFL